MSYEKFEFVKQINYILTIFKLSSNFCNSSQGICIVVAEDNPYTYYIITKLHAIS